MGDLKGLLDKEGIDINPENRHSPSESNLNQSQSETTATTDNHLANALISDFERLQKESRSQSLETLIHHRETQADSIESNDSHDSASDNSSNSEDEGISKHATYEPHDTYEPVKLSTSYDAHFIADKDDSSELDAYISDIEDDSFDIMDFASSAQELEEKVGSITAPEHLYDFEEKESKNVHLHRLKTELQRKLNQQINQSIDELKEKLLKMIQFEIDSLFKK